ncbi:ChaN family lipoprotein [Chitinibacter sp. GC72]|uniref:ChaN family lipoprotein n=1 Tax=Chitinibacter sp. GC72 TaxID=1526917 RepID=UPI0012FA3C22|nr:ChaN family lipoprotein [Chitinibacter sp. GC72]
MKLLISSLAGLVLLSGCASVTPPSRYVLLGEVHDNAEGHQQRVADLRAKVAAGWRPAIALEQFDYEFQPQLSAAQSRCGSDTRCIIDAAQGSKRWDWAYYVPLLTLAQQYQLPLLAANLSRADASKIVKTGFTAALKPELIERYQLAHIPAALLAGQIEAVRSGHCNQLPESLLPGMARAQIARDVLMADVMLESMKSTGRDVVLIAGNGHVRRDLGVPQWLKSAPLHSTAYLEAAPAPGMYDSSVLVKAMQRGDVCAMR